MDSTLPNPHSYSCRYCQDASRIPPTSCLAFHKSYSAWVAPRPWIWQWKEYAKAVAVLY